jgi:hypothetical protein
VYCRYRGDTGPKILRVMPSYRVLSSARIASLSSSRGASSFLSTRSNCYTYDEPRCDEEIIRRKDLVDKQEEMAVGCIEVGYAMPHVVRPLATG